MQFRFQSASPTIRQSNEIQNVCRGLFLVSGSVLLRAGVSQLGFRFRLERRERGYGDMAFTSSSSLAAPSSSSPSPSASGNYGGNIRHILWRKVFERRVVVSYRMHGTWPMLINCRLGSVTQNPI